MDDDSRLAIILLTAISGIIFCGLTGYLYMNMGGDGKTFIFAAIFEVLAFYLFVLTCMKQRVD